MGLEELVVSPHETTHLVDQVTEDLHAAYTVEILRAGVFMLQGIGKICGKGIDGSIGVHFVGCNARQNVAAHLGPAFDNGAKILFCTQIAADQVSHRHADGDGAVAVAELPVIIGFEQGAHGVIFDGEGVDHGICGLNLSAEIFVKTVLVDAFTADSAPEAAQTSALEGEFPQIENPGGIGQLAPEPGDHPSQLGVVFLQIGDDDHITGLSFKVLLRYRYGNRNLGSNGIVRLKIALFGTPDKVGKPAVGLLPALFGGQVFHIGGKTPDKMHAHFLNVVLNITVGSHVVEMLGGGDLGCNFSGYICTVLLHEGDKPVQLAGSNEGVDRVREQQHICFGDGFQSRREVLCEGVDFLAHMEDFKGMPGVFLLQIQDSLQCDAVFSLGASV